MHISLKSLRFINFRTPSLRALEHHGLDSGQATSRAATLLCSIQNILIGTISYHFSGSHLHSQEVVTPRPLGMQTNINAAVVPLISHPRASSHPLRALLTVYRDTGPKRN
ncbi:hypothetical protein HGRIS_008667 [Hohenbuehelia grisea]|uniref:Uncharacterized protein n=1 Tax=Hohenbuehelia grisea TaxID=104357 RepID=A0ABR3J953_9AGAR